ncbi:unnamed protein product, partial [Brugia timori]|uniref:PadR family transcriptional regulator n=1 Tax=Brugia timori TaxID=42155 RepID=A0A0R3Q555_9BILA
MVAKEIIFFVISFLEKGFFGITVLQAFVHQNDIYYSEG